MNTLNLIGPVLLVCAALLMAYAQFGSHLPAQRQQLLQSALGLILASLAIRVIWGIGVKIIAKRIKQQSRPNHST